MEGTGRNEVVMGMFSVLCFLFFTVQYFLLFFFLFPSSNLNEGGGKGRGGEKKRKFGPSLPRFVVGQVRWCERKE